MAPNRTENTPVPKRTLAQRVNDVARDFPGTLIWRASDGRLHHRSIGPACLDLPLQAALPVREIPNHKGKQSRRYHYWFGQTGGLIGCESGGEYSVAMLVDHDWDVAAITSQPVAIGLEPNALPPSVPDFWVAFTDGARALVEVKPDGHVDAYVEEHFATIGQVCRDIGWEYVSVPEPPPQVKYNLSLIAGFRQPQYVPTDAATDAIVEFCQQQRRIVDVADMLSPGAPATAKPAVYNLLWRHVLETDLDDLPIEADTLVIAGVEETVRES